MWLYLLFLLFASKWARARFFVFKCDRYVSQFIFQGKSPDERTELPFAHCPLLMCARSKIRFRIPFQGSFTLKSNVAFLITSVLAAAVITETVSVRHFYLAFAASEE